MNVEELIEELSKFPLNQKVYIYDRYIGNELRISDIKYNITGNEVYIIGNK